MRTKREEIEDVDIKSRKREKPPINSQEYVDEMIERKHRNIKIGIIAVAVIMVILLAAIIPALMTMSSSKIIRGVTINSIDVSRLDKTSACKLLEERIKQRQEANIKLKYQDYEKDLNFKELEITANIEEAVDQALKKGRDNNIFINNLNILKSKFKRENIELNINYNDEVLERNLVEVSTNVPGIVQECEYSIEDDKLVITKGKDGIVVEKDKIKEKIVNEIKDLTRKVTTNVDLTVKEQKAGKVDIEKIYEEIYSEPQDAYIVDEPFQVIPDKDGVDLAITMEEAKAILAEDKEEYSIPLKITKAKVTVAELGTKAFPNRLSNFTTRYDAGNISRTTNLGIATRKINEYVVQPGEIFSYNKALGKRTVENGYKEAAVFENGGVTNGIGGGICQISTTLYNAVLQANLEIVERHNHSFVTSYADPGKDATVVYGALDFKFKNNRKYPVKIVASLNSGVASVSIFGLKEEVEYNVKIVSNILERIPCAVEKIEDSSLPKGTEKIVTAGTNGCKSVTYKYLYTQSGELVSKKELSRDTYSTIKKTIKVGTGGVQQTVSTPDPTPTQKPSPSAPTEPITPVDPEPSETPDPTPTQTPDIPEEPDKPEPSPTPSVEPENPEPTNIPEE